MRTRGGYILLLFFRDVPRCDETDTVARGQIAGTIRAAIAVGVVLEVPYALRFASIFDGKNIIGSAILRVVRAVVAAFMPSGCVRVL